MIIDITNKEQLIIETFINKANGGAKFTGIRFREGKRQPKTLFHFHYGKAWQIIDALQECINSIKSETQDSFYQTPEWQRVRYLTLKEYKKCCLCGSSENLHVVHIKPRSKYPELELNFGNLQVLCKRCNMAKSNRNSEYYRSN